MRTGTIATVESAIQRYFDLMYDCEIDGFDEVFHPTAQLHGVMAGALTVWPAAAYREILAQRRSPKELQARRQEEILLLDTVGQDQALAKVRVRINDKLFADHLCFLRVDGHWRVTSKTFHLEQDAPMSTPAESIPHFESARVVVTEWRLPPGAETGHHVHSRDYVVVPLTDGTLRMHDEQGSSDAQLRAGEAYARPAGIAHNVTNPTRSEFRFVEIELK